jgi:hypothetical protein
LETSITVPGGLAGVLADVGSVASALGPYPPIVLGFALGPRLIGWAVGVMTGRGDIRGVSNSWQMPTDAEIRSAELESYEIQD